MATDKINSCSEDLIRGFVEVKTTAQVQFLVTRRYFVSTNIPGPEHHGKCRRPSPKCLEYALWPKRAVGNQRLAVQFFGSHTVSP
jgi:hypothetical protein